MEWMNMVLSAQAVADYETLLEDWGTLAFLALFGLEVLRLAIKRRLSWNIVGDSVASFLTFGLFIVVTYGLIAAAYVSVFYWAYLNFALVEIPVTPWSVALLVVLCDLAYYWEHRFTHRMGLAWATHSVHHSSPNFNISVAYRFGPMDGFWPVFFHLPLAVVGFNPIVIFACEAFVQLYQTVLHTEVVKKLPRPVEAIMNTPSHHRVHHGTNDAYIDKNYGGIFIIWDKLFGTFAEERETVRFGLTKQIDSNNPLTVYFHGFLRLLRRAFDTCSYREAGYALVAPPEWKPGDRRGGPQAWLIPATLVVGVALGISSIPGIADQSIAGTAEPAVLEESTDPASDGEQANQLRSIVRDYYENYLADRTDAVYTAFSEDALFHYRMDFGNDYGSAEFSFRADDPDEFDDSLFEGYEPLDASYDIVAVRVSESGGTVDAVLTESYRWNGYQGEMNARERFRIERLGGRPTVTRFSSEQVYR